MPTSFRIKVREARFLRMNPPVSPENDWKQFSRSLPVWRERYLERQNVRLAALLTAPGETPTDRFWALHKEAHEQGKILRECLDGASRSRMLMMLLSMRRFGMITAEDLAGFSPQLREGVFPERESR